MSILLLAACACGGDKDGGGGAARKEASFVPPTPLDLYRMRLAEPAKLESAALAAYEGASGSKYKDDATLVAALKDVTLPRYREFVAALDKVKPPAEAEAVHKRLHETAKAELSVLERMAGALDRGDGTALIYLNREQEKLAADMKAVLGEWRAVASKK